MKFLSFEITIDELKTIGRGVAEAFRRFRVPKSKKRTVGIVIAIKTEDNKTKQRLECDLIAELRQQFQDPSSSIPFSIVQFPESISRRIGDRETAALYLRRARAHFIVYGDLVQRQLQGQLNYVFRVYGLVTHAQVPRNIGIRFAREFSELLPHRLAFQQADELLGFEFTHQWISQVARYIIGIAALISGNPELALDLFLSLQSALQSTDLSSDVPVLSELKKRIPLRLIDTYQSILAYGYGQFARSRDRNHILRLREVLHKLTELAPDYYQARLMWAILLFFEGKTDEAIDQLKDLREKDATWRFSLGFLYAFKGDIGEALEQYRRAMYGQTPENVINDTEVFISDVIESHPEKTQLYFFRGLVNYKGKLDYKLAKDDFEHFLSRPDSSEFPKLVQLAEKYLSDIRIHVGI